MRRESSLLQRLLGRRPAPRAAPRSARRFAEFEPLDGPVLVGGPTIRHDQRLDGAGRLVVLMPHLTLDRMSGGPNTIFQVTAPLVRENVPLRYVAAFGPVRPHSDAIRAHIEAITGTDVSAEDVQLEDASAPGAVLGVGADDIFLATWWPTAHVALAGLDHVRSAEFVYLIQDYEPGFYPWSTKHALAAATYEMPARAIVNEPLLLDHLRGTGTGRFDEAGRAISFFPAVDRGVFRPRAPTRSGPRRLAFYARPKNARNLFELGLRALRVAVAEGVFDGREWEFRAIGQDLPDLPLSSRHVLRTAPWMSYERYGGFLQETDVLLSLMLSPHTSYPPLEIAATGGQAVTNTFGVKTVDALAALSPLIRGAAPDVPSIVAALRTAVTAAGTLSATADLALPATWDAALADVTPWLAATIAELRAG